MTHDAEPVAARALGQPARGAGTRKPLSLAGIAASVFLIVLAAAAIACLVGVAVVLVLYARLGLEGLTELYQDLRFDLAFKTEIGAVVVGTFYASVAAATIGAAFWRGGRAWQALIAWLPVRGPRRTSITIFVATLAYAALVTLWLTLTAHRPVINVEGPTNFVLLGTFAANLVIMAPCGEELFFRGWLFTGLRQHLAFWPTLLITATLFAAIHWDLHRPRMLLVLPLAFATGILRELTGSVKPAIALHVAYNLAIVTIKLWET